MPKLRLKRTKIRRELHSIVMPRQKKDRSQKRQERISIGRHFDEGVKEMAEYYGVDHVDIATRAFERGYSLIYREYVEHREQIGKLEEGSSVRAFLIKLAAGEFVGDCDLSLIAHDASIDVEILKTIRDCLQKNGGAKPNAHIPH